MRPFAAGQLHHFSKPREGQLLTDKDKIRMLTQFAYNVRHGVSDSPSEGFMGDYIVSLSCGAGSREDDDGEAPESPWCAYFFDVDGMRHFVQSNGDTARAHGTCFDTADDAFAAIEEHIERGQPTGD